MAVQLAYVEDWNSRDFPDLPVRLNFEDLMVSLFGTSKGHDGKAKETLPYLQERSGMRMWREDVEVSGEDVLRGHLTVANAITEAWCKDNPSMFAALIDGWIAEGKASDDKDKTFSRKWEERLAYKPRLLDALRMKDGAGVVCERAGLTPFQTRAVELMLDGRSRTEIGVALGISRQSATERIEAAFEKILGLDRVEE